MELCLGSLQDFYDGRLADCVSNSCFDIVNITWDILCGLEFLHKNNIPHGSLGLRKILLIVKRVESNTKKIVAKVSGYTTHYNPVSCRIHFMYVHAINIFFLIWNRIAHLKRILLTLEMFFSS